MKFVVYGVDSIARGDFIARATPTWVLGGRPEVVPGSSFTVEIPDDVAEKEWMQLGGVVLTRPHADLPLWAGVIDTPWKATSPVKVTLYSIEYLLKLRTPDYKFLQTGTAAVVLAKMIELANAEQDLFLRIGDISALSSTRHEETITQTYLWDQFKAFAERTGTQFVARPEAGKSLTVYFDLAERHGYDTNYLLYDGDGGNMTIESASVEGEIWNRVSGINTQSTVESRLQSGPQRDDTSIQTYRMRSRMEQFDVISETALTERALRTLDNSKNPYVIIKAKILNHEHVFRLLRLGNSFITHASKLRLPGGVQAWKGVTSIYAMTYNEADMSVSMTLTGVL